MQSELPTKFTNDTKRSSAELNAEGPQSSAEEKSPDGPSCTFTQQVNLHYSRQVQHSSDFVSFVFFVGDSLLWLQLSPKWFLLRNQGVITPAARRVDLP